MARLIVLGSSNAIADETHENTHLVLQGVERTVLIDCVNNPLTRLHRTGIEFNDLTDLILTHFHPDHVSGVPLVLMNMWLLGRTRPLEIYGLRDTLDRLQTMLDLYNWTSWPNFFPVNFHRLASVENVPVLDSAELHIVASPVKHLVPTLGLRIDWLQSGKSLAYSCDTEPCQQVIALASGVDILIHEASGAPATGHTSARQAGEIAQAAGAKALCLIHYPTRGFDYAQLVEQARQGFRGDVFLAEDMMELKF